jgi:four helix bundle protein
VEEEADESAYWLELLVDSDLMSEKQLRDLMLEANELVAITVASIKTARKRQ